jgi:arylsulfatase A
MLTRRHFAAGLAAAPLLGAADKKPNVVLIMTDDQGYGDFSRRKNPVLSTPQLDRLASESVEFTRFSVSPVCAPTRAALLTGRYPLRTGVHGVTKGRENMGLNEVTVAQAMRGAGYRTSLVGKWHLGENYPYVPHARGFDEFVGFRPGHWNWYFDAPAERNGKETTLPGYVGDALTSEAMRIIDGAKRDPFFLYLAYNTPHAPYQVPDGYFDKFAGKGLSVENQAIYGMVSNLDDNIGRLMAHLEKRGVAEDTIVMFLCDNGPQTARYNAGLRARKGSVYEGGTRSPLYVRYPKGWRQGRQVDTITGHIDVTPTLLDLCEVKRPEGPAMDGVSLRPLLEGAKAAWPPRMIFTHADQQPDPTKPWPGCARSQQYKMVNGTELYDLVSDPGEEKNLAKEKPEELSRLNAAYDKWFASTLEGFEPGAKPIPVGYREENPARLHAPQAELRGGLRFHMKFGYAHDFVTGWSTPEDAMSWRVDAKSGGPHRVRAEYRCAEPGPKLTLIQGARRYENAVKRGVRMDEIHLPHRAHNGNEAPVVHWGQLELGVMALERGVNDIRLEVSGGNVDIKTLFVEVL